VRVLLSSGYSEAEATRRFVGRGLAGFLQKPYRPGALVEAVRRALAG
jgi:DNA-binding NarL/FixJ family response regulator